MWIFRGGGVSLPNFQLFFCYLEHFLAYFCSFRKFFLRFLVFVCFFRLFFQLFAISSDFLPFSTINKHFTPRKNVLVITCPSISTKKNNQHRSNEISPIKSAVFTERKNVQYTYFSALPLKSLKCQPLFICVINIMTILLT